MSSTSSWSRSKSSPPRSKGGRTITTPSLWAPAPLAAASNVPTHEALSCSKARYTTGRRRSPRVGNLPAGAVERLREACRAFLADNLASRPPVEVEAEHVEMISARQATWRSSRFVAYKHASWVGVPSRRTELPYLSAMGE